MFLGVQTYNWSYEQIRNECVSLAAQGVDTVFLKVADGAFPWYGDPVAVCTALKTVINVVPYQYCYGGTFGGLDPEIALTNRFIAAGFTPMLDMEIEYNGRTDWCQYLVNHLAGQVHISTWADPELQNWSQNLRVLNSKTYLFFPQVYTPYLQSVWKTQYRNAGIDLNKCVPTITPATISEAQGLNCISLWESTAFSNSMVTIVQSELIQEVITTMNTNTQQKKQAEDVWNANTVGAASGTGIYAVYMDQYMQHNRVLGTPTTKEIKTVDWTGVSIQKQFFGSGVSIEWYNEAKNGHAVGETHGYSLTDKLW